MKPKFSIGETVILQSIGMPKLNGKCVVLSIHLNLSGYAFNLSTGEVSAGSRYGYILSIGHPMNGRWDESVVKKNHEPSNDSFLSIMSALNKPNTVYQKD